MKKKKKKSFGKFILAIMAATMAALIAVEINIINKSTYLFCLYFYI